MRTYYCVTTKCYDSGRVFASITSKMEAEKEPRGTVQIKNRYDLYTDWFDSKEDAAAFVERAMNI